jgi:hypothetical protein
VAKKTEIRTEVDIPPSLGLDDKTKGDLKKQFEAALQGVLNQNAVTKAKQASVSLFWKTSDEK